MHDNPNVLHISKKAFLSVLFILITLILAAGILSFLIPSGTYLRDAAGTIIPDSYTVIDKGDYPAWRWLTAPIEVLFGSDAINVIAISVFLLVLGGSFNVMDKTGGILVLIKRLIDKFKHRKYLLLRLVVLVFMSFGAFFGIFEESIALLPIIILLSLSLGWDTMTGLGMCMLAAGFGFAAAVTNPFSVGIASNIAGIQLLSGSLYRLVIFAIIYVILTMFLVRYAKKIERYPEKSLTYDADLKKNKHFDLSQKLPYGNEPLVYKVYVCLFLLLLIGILGAGVVELVLDMSIPAIPLMAAIFLFGGFSAGIIVTKKWWFTSITYLKGMLTVAPAIVLILLAISVKHIITEAQVMDTILHYLFTRLDGRSPIEGVLFIYGLVLTIQVFIGSSSAKAFLVMPLLVPLVELIGLSKEIAILAFVFGDGFTNVIFPTNGVLLIGLSIASVSYVKWFKWTIKLQLFVFGLTILFLVIGIVIGY